MRREYNRSMILVGQRLSQERQQKGLSIDEIAKATKIRPNFIASLEKGEYKKLPSSAYIQGFIKIYAEYLGLPQKEILALFRREFNEREFLGVLPESFSQNKLAFSGFRLRTTTLLIIAGLLFICGFLFFEYRSAFFSPSLSVISPNENATVNMQSVTITGKTDPDTTVTIDDMPVFIDKDGKFKKDVAVFTGSRTIVIKALNKFGRRSILLRHIIVK